jgi:hypothetical protein
MRRFAFIAPLVAMLLFAVVAGCSSGPGLNSTVTDLRGRSAADLGQEIRPVGHRSQPADESVVLEGDLTDEAAPPSRWQRLLHPFQGTKERIPLPLSPKSAHADVQPDLGGF